MAQEFLCSVSLMRGNKTVRSKLGQIAKGKVIISLEEPWVTAEIQPECDASMSLFYRQSRTFSGWRTSAKAAAESCQLGRGLYGWNQRTYAGVLRAALRAEGIQSYDFVGASFAIFRRGYLTDVEQPRKTTIHSPAPRPKFTIPQIVRHQGQAATSDTARGSSSEGAKPGNTDINVTISGRSFPVTHFDVLSARYSEILDSSAMKIDFSPKNGHQVGLIGRASDALWRRYGRDSLALSYLAFLDETCRVYKLGDHESGSPTEERWKIIPFMLHAPCQGVQVQGGFDTINVDCLAVPSDDPRVPSPLSHPWRASAKRVDSYASRNHGLASASLCTQKWGALCCLPTPSAHLRFKNVPSLSAAKRGTIHGSVAFNVGV